MKIYIGVHHLSPFHLQRLRDRFSEHPLVIGDSLANDEARRAAVAESEIVFGNVSPDWLSAAPALRWVQLDSAGVDRYLKLNTTRSQSPVIITHLSDFYGRAVAETALGGILAHYRNFPPLIRAQSEKRWVKNDVQGDIGLLHGSRIILLGLGSLGQRIRDLLIAFDCEVTAFARSSPGAALHTLDELDLALPTADVVINTLPHTPATIGLLDQARLARFAPHALFVNVGRGSVLDETALIDALDQHRLGGAFLDVTAVEPLPANSPLWTHPKVILTQHSGGRFPHETDRKIDVFLNNLNRFEKGQPLVGVIDSAKGY